MSETPLQRLLRMKKEKENAGTQVQPAPVTEDNSNSPLETVQGASCDPETGSGSSEAGTDPVGRGELLPEAQGEATPNLEELETSVSDPVVDPEPVVVPEVTQPAVPAKPMSAMDRIRALKSGVKQDGGVHSGSNGGSAVSVHTNDVALVTPEVPTVIKPRKTHPIAMEMAELEEALNSQIPGFVTILSQIHKKLRADPDVVTLLDDEEIGVIVAGLEKHTNVTIVAPSAVKAAKSKARKEPVTAMDL